MAIIADKSKNEVYIVGKGQQKYGVLANGNNEGTINTFKRLRRLEELQIIMMWTRGHSVIGQTVNGEYYAWGRNQCS